MTYHPNHSRLVRAANSDERVRYGVRLHNAALRAWIRGFQRRFGVREAARAYVVVGPDDLAQSGEERERETP